MKQYFLILMFLVGGLYIGCAQTMPKQAIDTVFITSSRINTNQNKLPVAVSVIQMTPEDATRQQLSIQEYLQPTAGVFVQNASNFAQDARISIRGFGARAAFGIRGVRLIVDGIPETTPDGQGQLDNLNFGIIDRIEITKGASSSLYGNASGGVIAIQTKSYKSFYLDSDSKSAMQTKVGLGAFGFQNYQATAMVGDSLASYIFHGNYVNSQGYRDQSGFEQINTNFKGEFQLSGVVRLTTIVNFADSPKADDAGSLTLEEIQQDRRQARDRNSLFETGERISQFKSGVQLEWEKSKAIHVNGYGFYSNRTFYGLLPFENGGIVDLYRNHAGQGTSLTYKKRTNTLQIGYDLAYQNDHRKRYDNLEGSQGSISFGQKEKFTNLGVYVLDHQSYKNWFFNAGLRYDYNVLTADDFFLEDGNDSGSLVLSSFNPSFGVSYAFAKALTLYTSFATSFETPALSELSSNPDGNNGFNTTLKPQKALSYEMGSKGVIGKLDYQLALFIIATQDDLVPFELQEFPDRTFYRNAGKSSRNGVELEMSYPVSQHLKSRLSYAFSDFRYDIYDVNGEDYSQNNLPGIPKHTTSMGIQYANGNGLSASLNLDFIGRQYADDRNSALVDGYELVSLRAAYAMTFRNAKLKPYLAIQNALNQKYTDNVRINAFGARYYEPAPLRSFFGGVVIDF